MAVRFIVVHWTLAFLVSFSYEQHYKTIVTVHAFLIVPSLALKLMISTVRVHIPVWVVSIWLRHLNLIYCIAWRISKFKMYEFKAVSPTFQVSWNQGDKTMPGSRLWLVFYQRNLIPCPLLRHYQNLWIMDKELNSAEEFNNWVEQLCSVWVVKDLYFSSLWLYSILMQF